MRCQIHVEGTSGDERPEWDLVIAIDEGRALLARDETLLDIILGEIARMHPFSSNGTAVNAQLERLARDGLFNPACLVPADAVQLITCPDYFSPSGLPTVRIVMNERSIVLPSGTQLSLDDFCGTPPDRWEGPRYRRKREAAHIFSYRYHSGEGDVHPTDLEAGSLVTGLFGELMPGPWGLASHEFVLLSGVLLGRRGDLFRDCVSGLVRTGASAMAEMRSTFLSEGHVASNRAWMPQAMLPGRDFHLCRAAARPDLLAFGARLAPIAQRSTKDAASAAILHVLDAIGEDPVQFSLPNRHARARSNHEALEMKALIRGIAAAAGLDPETLEVMSPR